MKVYIPTDYKGEILSLTDWLIKTGRHVEDVMRPNFVSSYNKLIKKQYSNEDKQLVKDIFDKNGKKISKNFLIYLAELKAQ